MMVAVPCLPLSPNRLLSIYTSVFLMSKFLLSLQAYEVAKKHAILPLFQYFAAVEQSLMLTTMNRNRENIEN